ncbi:MAG: ABC transporter ATP-binding protein [Planctomycetaceae bacterium]|nr:ABC transporter ATP-binding protein [Planctomycetaceae bacterium]
MKTTVVVELEQVTFRRQERTILSDISWRIEAGEHWALLGANGSGKTTLLKILTGYEWPTLGTVRVLGQLHGDCDIRHLRQTIGWVSSALTGRLPMQDTALEVAASGLDASIGLYREITEDERQQALMALGQVRAEAIAAQPCGTLSQGEMQKALIARALVCRPRLLILDEPCIGLDPAARARFLDDLEQMAVAESAPTLILVTHHIEEIGPWVRKVMLLKDGRSVGQGPPRQMLTSERMTDLFDFSCSVQRSGQGYALRMDRQKS